MANALFFAAALGHAEGRRTAFEKTSEAIPWDVLANAGAETFIDMLAGVVADETDILGEDRADDRLSIFEEYANGGLEVLAEKLAADGRPPLTVLIDLMLERESPVGKPEIDLRSIADEFSS